LLSKQPYLPAALDDTADASHEILPRAIFAAFLNARRANVSWEVRSPMLLIRPTSDCVVCYDNFA